jgi:hypothetical protein
MGSRIIDRNENTNEHALSFLDRRVKIQNPVGRIKLHFYFGAKVPALGATKVYESVASIENRVV